MAPTTTAVRREWMGLGVLATQLPGDVGAALLGVARLSFTSGFHAAALISAGIAIALLMSLLSGCGTKH